MWTPKRVLLLVAGFALLFATYAVYAHFLGVIDGLPPLPEAYAPSDEPLPPLPPMPRQENEADRRLRLAFGPDCDEVKNRSIKVVLNDRGLVLATDECNVEPDGRVKLTPFSVAIFSKNRDAAGFPEINTIRAATAYLTFDRPIKNQTEIGNRKIVGGELIGRPVTITNNRRTPQKTDDIEVTVLGEPLFFSDKTHHIWSEGMVHLVDSQSVPNPTDITAKGIDIYLATAAPRGNRKAKGETVSGVERIVLRRDVDMHLYVDAGSGFPGNARENGAAAEPRGRTGSLLGQTPRLREARARTAAVANPDPNRDHVNINTNGGPFTYDLPRDLATFDIPRTDPRRRLDYQVVLIREHELGAGKGKLTDQLSCHHLEIQFRRKKAAEPQARPGGQAADREIESAHATGDVILCLDTQFLEARGQDLVYRCPTPQRGPEAILQGSPLKAYKDCNVIQARKLWLIGSAKKGDSPEARAQGPGQIDLADRASATPRHPVHVYWKDRLVSTKDGKYDLLILTGGASFVDDDHKQQLHGKRLQIWLDPAERQAPPPGEGDAPAQATPSADAARQRPRRLEAYQHVSAHSPDMNIRETEHLTVWFRDVPPAARRLPAGAADAEARTLPAATPAGPKPEGRPGPPSGTKEAPEGDPNAAPKKPINLRARSVVAYVDRDGDKNELQKLVTEGAVAVHQEGKTPKDKGVDITGETLELVHHPQGDLLVVLGDSRGPARLRLEELLLVGPRVTIDQKENTAAVRGVGYMNMPSNTSFEGGKPARPGTRLEVHWNQAMDFNGKDAAFYGGITATQDSGRMKGNNLQVTLDRAVSFKEGQKRGQTAKVEKMVCDSAKGNKVFVEDTTRTNGKLEKYSRLDCYDLSMDNVQGQAIGSGPGVVYLVQPGAVDNGWGSPPPDAAAAAGQPKEEMKLTRIEFEGQMRSQNQAAGRMFWFYDNVEVVNLPGERADVPVDKDRLPPRGMYLRAGKLRVYPGAPVNGRPTQNFLAEIKVSVRTPEFQAQAAKVSYEEAKDLLIFEAAPGSMANFYRLTVPGKPPERISGRKIFYNRRTRQFRIEDGGSMSN